jgi:hypothetical protein
MMAASVGGGTHAVPSIMMCGVWAGQKRSVRLLEEASNVTHHGRHFLPAATVRHCSAAKPETTGRREVTDALARWWANFIIADLKYLSTTFAGISTTTIPSASLLLSRTEALWYAIRPYYTTLLQNALLYLLTKH